MSTAESPPTPAPTTEAAEITPPSPYQEQFIRLLREITSLQWVRESLPAHARHYENLKQKLKREQHLKSLLDKQWEEYRKKQDTQPPLALLRGKWHSSGNPSASERQGQESIGNDVIEPLRACEAKILQLETQLEDATAMMSDLTENRRKLDNVCHELHVLYDELVNDDDHHAGMMEQRLRAEVHHYRQVIPQIEDEIRAITEAQTKLYHARDLMEKAMMTLPGASTFLDRQAMVGQGVRLGKHGALSVLLDASVSSLKDAERLAQQAYQLEAQASSLCPDVPLIPTTTVGRDEQVENVLTAYRGYRLKLETSLRTRVNPRLNKLQGQLAMNKFHNEQKTIEWIDQQIVTIEDMLRRNGCLADESLESEIAMLRMGSNAAIAAAEAETSGRVTVDDVLDVGLVSNSGDYYRDLPVYTERTPGSSGTSGTAILAAATGLPAYSHTEDPPAYTC